ncbi:hypothetical protein [Fluviispira sanaruensis]|uniref:Uncharacterized protein n=1 Tax=Fluviispira sanaruensis TaxID=2493639 RepID=A0A4P2VR34_FLUSA|nr:hypothetical protein [Fluviispira sanaruensis]BBH54629.1 hypothetical protein JCM31447_31030 [Fluviispira sanaruensis]
MESIEKKNEYKEKMFYVNENQSAEVNEKSENLNNSRRGFLSLAFLAGAGIASVLKEKVAKADPIGGDTAALTELTSWLKFQWATHIVPTAKTIKESYEMAKGWVEAWNGFVTAYNEAARFIQDGVTALTSPEENIFYLQLKQMIDYVDRILEYRGNILSFRLHYLNPVLMQKIDSYISMGQSFSRRARNLAMLQYYKKDNEDEITDAQRRDFMRRYPNSNIERASIRASNDIANYGYESLRIEALKDTVEFIKKEVTKYPIKPGKPGKGEAPQKSRGQVFQELSAVTSVDIALQQTHLLNEINIKLTNLMMIMTQAGQGPVISDNEQIVTKEMFAEIARKMQMSIKEINNPFLKKNGKEEKNKKDNS